MCASLMTVADMIEYSFGDPDNNIVNFRLLRAVLYVLAKQLNVLERNVAVDEQVCATTDRRSKVSVRQIKVKVRKKVPAKSSTETKLSAYKKKGSTISTASAKTKTAPKISTAYSMQTSSVPAFATVSEKSEATNMEKYHKFLEKIEEQREKVLRVIQKRENSKPEIDDSVTRLTPIASLESSEYEFERLLIVETFPELEEERHNSRTEEILSLVTLDQYNDLVKEVKELNDRFEGNYGALEFPDNIELMKKLRKGASLTDAMGVLQISARLEAIEKTIKKLLPMLGDISHITAKDATKIKSGQTSKHHVATSAAISSVSVKLHTHSEFLMDNVSKSVMNQFVTPEELNEALERERNEMHEFIKHMFSHPSAVWDKVLQQARNVEDKLKGNTVQQWNERFAHLEKLVSGYAQQVNIIDTTLSYQMSSFQEQLTQMHFDLESGLDNFVENMTSKAVDQNVMADLAVRVNFMTKHLDRANSVQKDLTAVQNAFAEDFQKVKKEIEILQDIKTDREELVDALRDVVGLKQLNGLVTEQYFYAVKGSIEQQIAEAYNRFDAMEKVWEEKYIQEVFSEIREKVNKCDMDGLAADIYRHLNKLKTKIQTMDQILGEPISGAVTRQVFRDTYCISCSTPAHILPELPPDEQIPLLPAIRPVVAGKEVAVQTEKPVCYRGREVKHPLDRRAELCTRYCGGPPKGHIIKKPAVTGIRIVPISEKGATLTIGTDGKAYQTDPQYQPCAPCNIKEDIYFEPEPLEADTPDDIAAIAATQAKMCFCKKVNCRHKPPSQRVSKISVSIDTSELFPEKEQVCPEHTASTANINMSEQDDASK